MSIFYLFNENNKSDQLRATEIRKLLPNDCTSRTAKGQYYIAAAIERWSHGLFKAMYVRSEQAWAATITLRKPNRYWSVDTGEVLETIVYKTIPVADFMKNKSLASNLLEEFNAPEQIKKDIYANDTELHEVPGGIDGNIVDIITNKLYDLLGEFDTNKLYANNINGERNQLIRDIQAVPIYGSNKQFYTHRMDVWPEIKPDLDLNKTPYKHWPAKLNIHQFTSYLKTGVGCAPDVRTYILNIIGYQHKHKSFNLTPHNWSKLFDCYSTTQKSYVNNLKGINLVSAQVKSFWIEQALIESNYESEETMAYLAMNPEASKSGRTALELAKKQKSVFNKTAFIKNQTYAYYAQNYKSFIFNLGLMLAINNGKIKHEDVTEQLAINMIDHIKTAPKLIKLMYENGLLDTVFEKMEGTSKSIELLATRLGFRVYDVLSKYDSFYDNKLAITATFKNLTQTNNSSYTDKYNDFSTLFNTAPNHKKIGLLNMFKDSITSLEKKLKATDLPSLIDQLGKATKAWPLITALIDDFKIEDLIHAYEAEYGISKNDDVYLKIPVELGNEYEH